MQPSAYRLKDIWSSFAPNKMNKSGFSYIVRITKFNCTKQTKLYKNIYSLQSDENRIKIMASYCIYIQAWLGLAGGLGLLTICRTRGLGYGSMNPRCLCSPISAGMQGYILYGYLWSVLSSVLPSHLQLRDPSIFFSFLSQDY